MNMRRATNSALMGWSLPIGLHMRLSGVANGRSGVEMAGLRGKLYPNPAITSPPAFYAYSTKGRGPYPYNLFSSHRPRISFILQHRH
jgi:hypothetical protein